MTNRNSIRAVAVGLAVLGCVTCAMTTAYAMDCGSPGCSIVVRVVPDGAGGRKIEVSDGGNVRMKKRVFYVWNFLVPLTWTLATPGYEFRGDSIMPYTGGTPVPGKSPTSSTVWYRQMIPASSPRSDQVYLTNRNDGAGTFYYNIKVYPTGPGSPITLDPAIMNDP